MAQVLWIGFAGAIGTIARYFVNVWAARALGTGLPYGTFLVNVVGCFLIAAIAHVATSTTLIPQTLRLTLMTGFLGGLTTYSSFNYETTRFFQSRAWAEAFLNMGATLVTCFLAGLLGLAAARRIFGP